jgi:hypothetical protein
VGARQVKEATTAVPAQVQKAPLGVLDVKALQPRGAGVGVIALQVGEVQPPTSTGGGPVQALARVLLPYCQAKWSAVCTAGGRLYCQGRQYLQCPDQQGGRPQPLGQGLAGGPQQGQWRGLQYAALPQQRRHRRSKRHGLAASPEPLLSPALLGGLGTGVLSPQGLHHWPRHVTAAWPPKLPQQVGQDIARSPALTLAALTRRRRVGHPATRVASF